jgi:hypothetical protein
MIFCLLNYGSLNLVLKCGILHQNKRNIKIKDLQIIVFGNGIASSSKKKQPRLP